MNRERRLPRFGAKHLLLAALVAVVAMVAFSFGRMMWTGFELKQRAEESRRQIGLLDAEYRKLQAEIEYLKTDQAVEELAREKLGWAKPGDTVLIVASHESEPAPPANVSPRARPASPIPNWRKWWKALIGSPAGDAP